MFMNQVQNEVVNYIGNGIVFASAGTGKTFTLATKINNMINLKHRIII